MNKMEEIIKVAMLENGEIQAGDFAKTKIDIKDIPCNVIKLLEKSLKMNNILELEITLKGFNLTKKMFDTSFVSFKNKDNGIYANITNENHEFPNSIVCFEDCEKEMIKKLYMAVK